MGWYRPVVRYLRSAAFMARGFGGSMCTVPVAGQARHTSLSGSYRLHRGQLAVTVQVCVILVFGLFFFFIEEPIAEAC
jgi:hypothetical protein